MKQDRVGVIGLGQMGSGMALRLAECGHDVLGFDASATARQAAAAAGLPVAADCETVIRSCGILLTSLPDSRAVRDVWMGPDGITEMAAKGTLCIDLSTIDPATMREAAGAGTANGLDVLDCPVSGSPNEARSGRLVVIAGGELAALARAEPLLLRLGANVQHTGAAGTAKVVKIVNNMMSMGNVLVAAEAFAVGEAAGVDPATLFKVLSQSGGRSHHFEKRFPNALQGNFDPGFKMELGEKDLALGVDLGRQLRIPTPTASQVRELFSIALAEGFRGQDIVALLALYRRWAQSN